MKTIIILSLILIFIVISGLECKLPFGKTDSDMPSMLQYRTGTNGLEIAFEGLIKEVPEGSIFQIPIELRNIGASEIREASVLIHTGEYVFVAENQEDFTKIDDKNKEAISESFEFLGRSPENPVGEIKYVFLNAKAGNPEREEYVSSQITAIGCFDYKTRAMADICVDTQKYKVGRIGARACEVRDISLAGGQGGPLAVTKINPDILYEDDGHVRLYFEIAIENKGKGDVFLPKFGESPGSKSGCLGSLGNRRNKAFISVTIRGKEEKLDCDITTNYKYKEAYFKDGKTTLTCTSEPISVNQPTYTTPIYIYLDYGYTITKTTNIKIKNIKKSCLQDFPLGSKCNDIQGTKCDAEGFQKEPVPTKDCDWGCCKFRT